MLFIFLFFVVLYANKRVHIV